MSVLSSSGKRGSVLVVGGGIGGMQAALDLADSGFKVHLVQKESSIGGTMSSLDKTFPTGDCAMCMISPKMVSAGRHLNIDILTQSEVTELSGAVGDFSAKVLKKSRFIDPKKCTGCMACVEKCPVFVPSEYDQGLVKRTAINRRYAQAVPGIVTVDKQGISPCRVDCPAEVNAHAYVTLTAAGRYKEALEVVRRTNPFPASIGRVCTHPCESACRRGDVDAPVQICYLKRFLTDWEDGHGGFVAPAVPAEKLEKVAVVGSGPAGMTCARDLALKGYQVTVFEKLPVAGGMLRVSIPAYRLPKDVVQKEVDQICSLGVELKVGQALGKDFTIDSLQQQGFKAIFVALGTHKALQLQIPGEKDFPQVLDCIAFLRDVNLDNKPDFAGQRVVVVGGGNAAIDSARTSLRLGAEVVIAYRRTVPEMPANSWEIEEAEEEGVKIQTLVAPVRVVGAIGKVTGLEVQKMQLGEPDKSGRRRPVPIEGSNYVLPCDVLIAAISQEPDLAGLEGENLATNKWQCFEADPATLATSRPGVFAGGDVVTGPSTVVQAIGMGRDGAESIHRYLRGLDLHENRPKLKDRTRFIKDIAEIVASPKAGMPKLPLAERRGNFKETELGFPEQMAVKEASRCLNCGGCCECYLCVDACLAKAIVHDSPYEEQVELQVGAVILAPGAQLYDARVRGELGLGTLAERRDLDPVRADPLRLRPLQGRGRSGRATARTRTRSPGSSASARATRTTPTPGAPRSAACTPPSRRSSPRSTTRGSSRRSSSWRCAPSARTSTSTSSGRRTSTACNTSARWSRRSARSRAPATWCCATRSRTGSSSTRPSTWSCSPSASSRTRTRCGSRRSSASRRTTTASRRPRASRPSRPPAPAFS